MKITQNPEIPDPEQLQPRNPDYHRIGWTMVFSLGPTPFARESQSHH
jgi:hypothetical protein